MPTLRIEGPNDERIAPYCDLQSGRHSPESFIVESTRLVERLIQSNFTTHSILVSEGKLESVLAMGLPQVPVYVGSKSELSEIAGFPLHRGCLAHAGSPTTELSNHLQRTPAPITVILESLADPANIGSIIRNAAAFGAGLVIVDPKGASPFSRKAARASAGHLFGIPVAIADPMDSIAALRSKCPDIEIIATTGHRGAKPLEQLPIRSHRAVVIGNEGLGVSEAIKNAADHLCTVPLADGVDSLNAAAASALSLYLLRERIP